MPQSVRLDKIDTSVKSDTRATENNHQHTLNDDDREAFASE